MTDAGAIDQATFDALLTAVGDDATFVASLVETYLGEAPELLAALQQAIAAGDAPAARRAAHTLKSTSASLGALRFSDLSGDFEMRALAGDAPGASDVAALRDEFAAVEATLRQYAPGAAP